MGPIPAADAPGVISPPDERPLSKRVARAGPLALLMILLALVLAALLARGLDLGFTGDLLDYAYHYERLGAFGGMRWLVVDHWQRHLIAGVFSAPIALLFPGQSWPWYAAAFLAHFAAAVMVYVLAEAISRGRQRWAAVLAALLFAFHPLHGELNFEFPTSAHGNSALVFALLSLWLYLQYVRRGRGNRWWREGSLAAYLVALATYEQTVLFFALHPLIAYFEDRANGALTTPGRWLARVALDSFWFPVAVAAYLFLLRVLFPPGQNLRLEPAAMASQIATGLRLEFGPEAIVSRIWAVVQEAPAAVIVVAVGIALGLAAWIGQDRGEADTTNGARHHAYLILFGLGMSLASILGIAPTAWPVAEHPRLIYPSAAGFGMALAGALGWLAARPRWRPAAVPVGLLATLLIAAGVVGLFRWQAIYAERQAARQRVLEAIYRAIPGFRGEEPPYLLIVTDAHPSTDLWLYAQDNRFPYLFDLHYGITGIAADAIYRGLDPALAPADDLPGSRYNGQFIVVEPEGIYSPLRPYEPIDPDRLVVVGYDSGTGEARVLDALPAEARAAGNIVERAPIDWRTNRALIEAGAE